MPLPPFTDIALDVGVLLELIRSTLDSVTLHLSDDLYDTVLDLVFEYASTTVHASAITPFSNLVSSLSESNPQKAIDKFLPLCAKKIISELENGASSVRTTTAGQPTPGDTMLHWCKLPYRISVYRKLTFR